MVACSGLMASRHAREVTMRRFHHRGEQTSQLATSSTPGKFTRRRATAAARANASSEPLESRVLLASIASGQTISASIGANGELDSYTFSATAGNTIVVAMGDTSA